MTIFYINNLGGGFAEHIEIDSGTTIGAFFTERMPAERPEDWLIRVNRGPVPADYVLQGGDRVSITPTKIEGA